MKTFTIGQIAKITDTSRVTLRYYERVGLILKPARSASSYRLYPETIIARLRFIKKAKSLGFSLEEVKELLALHDAKASSAMPTRQLVINKIDQVKTKINDLNTLEQSLQKLLSSCDGKMPIEHCPIMQNIFTK